MNALLAPLACRSIRVRVQLKEEVHVEKLEEAYTKAYGYVRARYFWSSVSLQDQLPMDPITACALFFWS